MPEHKGPVDSPKSISFGASLTAEGKVGPFGGSGGLNGEATFDSNGNYNVVPVNAEAGVGYIEGSVDVVRGTGNFTNSFAANYQILPAPQIKVTSGFGIFYFAGVHAGIHF